MLSGYFFLVKLSPYLSFCPSKYKDVVLDTLWLSASAVRPVVRDLLTSSLSIIFCLFFQYLLFRNILEKLRTTMQQLDRNFDLYHTQHHYK